MYSSPTRAPSPTFAWFATATTIAPEDTSSSSRTSRVSSARSSSISTISAVVRSRVNVAEGRPERRERHSGGFADRYTDRGGRDGRSGGGFAERYSESRGGRDGFTGGGGSFGRREGGGGYQEARGGRSDRRSFDRSRSNPDAPPPEGRKKLVLAARTVPLGDSTEIIATSPPSSKPNPFGAARPVDSSAKLARRRSARFRRRRTR